MRDGDGQISYFADARAIYLNHDYSSLPIGKMRNASIDSAGNWICNLFITNATAAARETFQLIQEGIINGVSIGFKSMDRGAPTQAEVQKYGPCWSVVRKWLWIELSITPQPCNPEAWITGIKSAPAESVVKEIQDRVKRGYVSAGTAKALGVAPVEPSPRRLVFL
jgi:HK97 family phage prohead protease